MTDYKVPGRSRQNGDVTVMSFLKCYVKQSVFALNVDGGGGH